MSDTERNWLEYEAFVNNQPEMDDADYDALMMSQFDNYGSEMMMACANNDDLWN